MRTMKNTVVLGVIATLVVTALLLVPADEALARTNFFFGLNLGVPVGPYSGYAYPPPGYYPPRPYYRGGPIYRVYPPCPKVWTPGYYDPYGNWIFGYYRYDCGYYGY